MEVSDEALDRLYLGIRINVDFFILRRIDHLRRQDARRAVERRERLVDLGHFAADGRLFLDDIDLKTRVRNVQRGLNTGDAAADDKCALGNGAGACRERRVELHLCDGRAAKDDGLLGRFFLVLVDPGALLADVRDLDHVAVQPSLFTGLAERLLVLGEGLMARCICHELDHLDGHMYTEKVEGGLHDVNYEEPEEE